jgi:hypothetical protein
MALGGFFFVMYLFHAYANYIGNLFIASGRINPRTGDVYNPGEILSCFLGTMFGIFALGMASPNMKAL